MLPLILLTACQQSSTEQLPDKVQNPATTAVTADSEKQIVDPVCGMVKTDSWTNYTIYKGDTVWFCAAIEKKAFLAHPEKYAQNIKGPDRH